MHLRVHNLRSSLNICRQMALFEMVQTLILRFANMEKWINSLNLSTLIFRTLQYLNPRLIYYSTGTLYMSRQHSFSKILHGDMFDFFLDLANLWKMKCYGTLTILCRFWFKFDLLHKKILPFSLFFCQEMRLRNCLIQLYLDVTYLKGW